MGQQMYNHVCFEKFTNFMILFLTRSKVGQDKSEMPGFLREVGLEGQEMLAFLRIRQSADAKLSLKK